jgi:hypothetical protein
MAMMPSSSRVRGYDRNEAQDVREPTTHFLSWFRRHKICRARPASFFFAPSSHRKKNEEALAKGLL